MKVWALNYTVVGKVGLGPTSYTVGDRMILTPQPSDEVIERLKLQGYLCQVEVDAPVPSAAVATATPAVRSFEVAPPASPILDALPPPVEEDDDLFTEAPAAGVLGELDYEAMPLSELREVAKSKGYTGYRAAHRATLIQAIKG